MATNTFFLIFVGIIGLGIGYIMHHCLFWIPHYLEKLWYRQSWYYLYPNKPMPTYKKIMIKKNSDFYMLIIMVLNTVLSICIILHFGYTLHAMMCLILIWSLLLLAGIDFKYQLLPDCLTLPLLWLGLFCNAFELFTTLQEAVFGAMIGYASLWFVAALFRYWRHIEGIGKGDFKLLALLGAWWGFSPLLFIVMFASFLGAVVGCIRAIRNPMVLKQSFPFGPYLIFSGLIALFYDEKIGWLLC